MVGDALELHENGGTNRYCDQGRRRQGVKKNKKLGLTLLLFVMNKVNIFPKILFCDRRWFKSEVSSGVILIC